MIHGRRHGAEGIMATAIQDFPIWLNKKLRELNTDETIFGSYIEGILDSDETTEEKSEALQGIVSEIVENENDITEICNEILQQWQIFRPKEENLHQMSSEEVNAKLAKLLESQSLATVRQKEYSEEDKKIKEAILSQYSEMTDEEYEQENGTVHECESSIEKNLNVQTVAAAERNKREQARLDSQKKKEKDKEDRDKQKQLKEEKKEKRKTVKGERKR